jgi:hypothetical protein
MHDDQYNRDPESTQKQAKKLVFDFNLSTLSTDLIIIIVRYYPAGTKNNGVLKTIARIWKTTASRD